MKNLSMNMKIFSVMGLLIVVAILISFISINTLSEMDDRINDIVNNSAEKVKLSARINQDLLKINRAEKNIILAKTQEKMDEHASEIKVNLEAMMARRTKLRGLVDENGMAKLDEFAAKWDKYIEVNAEVRKLARLNSNVKAMNLSKGKGQEAYDKSDSFMRAIAVSQDAKDSETFALLAGRVIQDMLSIHRAEKSLIGETTDEGMDVYAEAIKTYKDEMNKKLAEIETLASAEGKASLANFKTEWVKFTELDDEVRNLNRENGNAKALELSSGKGRSLANECQVLMKAIVELNDKGMADDKVASDKNYVAARWILILVSGIGILVAGILGFFILTDINRRLNNVANFLSEGSEQVASASSQVSSASQSLAEGSSEQAAAIEEISSSLEEISSMTKQNAENAGQADNLMKETNQVVGKANNSMNELISSMSEISKASEETSKIIKTIDEIAFQTNLLALNAAVEAARAGEAGAGFAVVADEVRNLAMRAADAAKNTASLIEGTVKKVNVGSALVTLTNKAFTQLATSSKKVGELMGEISAASNEQADGVNEVNTAVAEMDKVVQQNAANAEESASASEEMNAQAEQMRLSVGELIMVVEGAGKGNGRIVGNPTKSVIHKSSHPITHLTSVKKDRSKQLMVHKKNNLIPMDDDDFTDF